MHRVKDYFKISLVSILIPRLWQFRYHDVLLWRCLFFWGGLFRHFELPIVSSFYGTCCKIFFLVLIRCPTSIYHCRSFEVAADEPFGSAQLLEYDFYITNPKFVAISSLWVLFGNISFNRPILVNTVTWENQSQFQVHHKEGPVDTFLSFPSTSYSPCS